MPLAPGTALRTLILATGAAAAAVGLASGVAHAGPFCYQTGPGYEKCLTSPSGDYFHPSYQGPQIPDSYIPWVPDAPAPVAVPVPVPVPVVVPAPAPAVAAANCPEGTYNDPGNLSDCLPFTPGNDYVSLAAPPSNPAGGGGFGTAGTQAGADAIAMSQCVVHANAPCRIAAQAYQACAVYAVNPQGTFVSGGGPTLDAAAADALNSSSGGPVIGGHCADPPGN